MPTDMGAVTIQADGPPKYDLNVAYTLHSSGEINPQIPVLVLLHPFTTSQEYWQSTLDDPQLNSTFRMLTIDIPGHGMSTTEGRAWTHWNAATALLAILDKLDIVRAVVVGVSQGGFLGLRAAILDHDRSGIMRERKIIGVVCAASSSEEEAPDFVKQYGEMRDTIPTKSTSSSASEAIETLAQGMADDQIGPSKSTTDLEKHKAFTRGVIERSMTQASGGDGERFAKQITVNFNALLHREGIRQRLEAGAVSCPVLVLHGTEDAAYPLKDGYADRTVQALEKAGLAPVTQQIIEGAPHFLNVTHSEDFSKHVLDFVMSLA